MNVGEVCNREVIVVGRDASMLEVARVMRQHHVGDVIVTEARDGQQVPVGILTDRDIVVELLAEEVDLASVDAGDVMSFELVIANEGQQLSEAVARMRDKGVRRVPVVNSEGGLEGILALDDLIDLAATQLTDLVRLISAEQTRERRKRS